MLSIPLPFVVSFVLCLLLARILRQGQGGAGLFPLLVGACAVQAALSGLNWNLGWHPARLVQPVIAALLPALCFVAFDQLRRRDRAAPLMPPWLHLLPAAAVILLVAFWRTPIDAVLFATDLGYGLALLRIALKGPDALAAARLSDGWSAHRAMLAVGILLVITALVDAAVSLDLSFGSGAQARLILTVASVLWLAVAGYAATVAEAARPAPVPAPAGSPDHAAAAEVATVPEDTAAADADVVARIEALMTDQHLYRDPDLTLDRLARRAGIPARQISAALNRVHGRNVSQVVNAYRVADAQRRLRDTADPVTAVMLDSGFGTKSNFNREFLRVAGMTPSAYRRSHQAPPV
jgi:AraC-like DNA-binding protein